MARCQPHGFAFQLPVSVSTPKSYCFEGKFLELRNFPCRFAGISKFQVTLNYVFFDISAGELNFPWKMHVEINQYISYTASLHYQNNSQSKIENTTYDNNTNDTFVR